MVSSSPSSNIPILVAVVLASVTSGTTYAFGIYSSTLKESLHLTQAELDTISSVSFCAGIFAFFPGMVVDKLGGKLGIIIGGLCGCFWMLLYWAVARTIIIVLRDYLVATLTLLGVFIFLSNSLVVASVFKLIMTCCGPGSRGRAVGVAKAYVGLSAGLYAMIFKSLGWENNLDFLLMAVVIFAFAAVVPAAILLPSSPTENLVDMTTPWHFFSLYVGLFALAVLVVGQSILELFVRNEDDGTDNEGDEQAHSDYITAMTLFTVWCGPILGLLLLPVAKENQEDTGVDEQDSLREPLIDKSKSGETTTGSNAVDGEENKDCCERDEGLDDESKTQDEEEGQTAAAEESEQEHQQPESSFATLSNQVPSRNLIQMLQTSPSWLLLLSCTVLIGSGTVITNNLGQMVSSLGFSQTVTPSSLTLFSVAQSFGRVMTGAVSEAVVQRGQPRSVFLTIASIMAMVSHALLGVSTTEISFIVGIALSGLAFGMVWPLMVLTVGDLFGTDHHGGNYMLFDGATLAVGTLAISKGIAQAVYDEHGDGTNCSGIECFAATHWSIVALSGFCVILSLLVPCTQLSKQAYGTTTEQTS